MTRKLAKWTSEHGQTEEIRSSGGCGRKAFPLVVEWRYNFHKLGAIWEMSAQNVVSRSFRDQFA